MVQAKLKKYDELALPQLAGEAVCAAVQWYADFGRPPSSIVPYYRIFGLRFWGTRLLAARFVFPSAYIAGIAKCELVETVPVPLWGGPPVTQAIADASARWGLDLRDAEQRKQAFQLLTAMASELDVAAADAAARTAAAAQVGVSLAKKND